MCLHYPRSIGPRGTEKICSATIGGCVRKPILCNGDRKDAEAEKSEDKAQQNVGGENEPKKNDADDYEETIIPRALHGPRMPSNKEVEEHEFTHIPFRSWCNNCLRGKGLKRGHRQCHHEDDDMEAVPRFAMDYGYLNRRDAEDSEETY